MREFERAIERGEDIAVANFVLEQLAQGRARNRGRRRGASADRRSGAPVVSVRSSRFSSRAIFPSGPGRSGAHRCCRSGNGWAATGRPMPRAHSKPRSPRSGRAAATPASKARPASSSSPRPTRSSRSPRRSPGDDRQRALARIGPPNVVEDLLPIGRRAAGARGAGYARQPDARPDAGVCGIPDRLGGCGAQRSLVADAAIAAVRAVADHAAAGRAVADHPPRDQDGGIRR